MQFYKHKLIDTIILIGILGVLYRICINIYPKVDFLMNF